MSGAIKPRIWPDAASIFKNFPVAAKIAAKSAYCFGRYAYLRPSTRKEIGDYVDSRGEIYSPPANIVEEMIVMECPDLPESTDGSGCPFLNAAYDQLMKDRNERLKREIKSIDEYDVDGEVDACVIGTGPGGAAAAYALSEKYKDELKAGDKKIVMLERGPLYTSEDFQQKEAWALLHLYQKPLRFTDDFGIALVKSAMIGGTAVVNDAICFEAPTRVTQGWEADVGSELRDQGFYEKVNDMIHYQSVSELAQSRNARMFVKGVADEDQHFVVLNPRNTNPHIDPQPDDPTHQLKCVGCGCCHLGCRYNRKMTPLITYIPAAMDNGVRVFKEAKVVEVLHREGKVEGVRVQRGGLRRDLIIKAKTVVVAGGAINSAQLLLRSGIDNPHLGKHISLHPAPMVFAVFDENVYPDWGIPMTSSYKKYQFPDDNKEVFPDGLGYVIEALGNHPTAQAAAYPMGSIKERMKKYKNTASVTVIIHDSAVGEVRRKQGHITPLTYKVTREDQIKIKHGIKEAARIFFAAGAREVFTNHAKETAFRSADEVEKIDVFDEDQLPIKPGSIVLGSSHSQGGCRMSRSGKDGVVDFNGHSHDVRNLYVSDGSLFPTSLGVNPQLTIMALATKVGESIDLDA